MKKKLTTYPRTDARGALKRCGKGDWKKYKQA